MDKNITVKLFRMERARDDTPRFVDVLQSIQNLSDGSRRERSIATNFRVRLEDMYVENQHIIYGELLRIQDTNLPSAVSGGTRTALALGARLGHSIAFRANHHAGLLGVEFNNRVCSPGRIFSYMQEFDSNAVYNVLPVVREDAWIRYNRAPPRKVELSVAEPSDLRLLENEGEGVGEAIAAMGEAFNGPIITVSVSMGHSPGGLLGNVGGILREVLRKSAADQIDLRKLKVYNPEAKEGIDFLDELLTFKTELELDDRDPDINLQIKVDYLRRVMYGHA